MWIRDRINAVYNYYGGGEDGIDALYKEVSQLVGFRPDFEVVIEWAGVGELVDAIGGVDFEVPMRMRYYDPTQNLNIDLQKGYQHLDGEDVYKRQALSYALHKLVEDGALKEMPLRTCVAAISAGIVDDELLLDLCYEEDSAAQVDLNCVMTGEGELVELQGTGEGRAFTIDEQRRLVDLCAKGIREVQSIQKAALGG